MIIQQYCCIVWLAVTMVTVKGCSEICNPKPPVPGPLVAPRNDSDIIREGHAKRFLCCGEGFIGISWAFQANGSGPWMDVKSLAGKIQICNDGQELQILSVTADEEGLYRCTQNNGTATVSAYHKLVVVACTSMHQPPRIMTAPQNVTARVGDTVTFACKAFFGCGDPLLKNIVLFSLLNHNISRKQWLYLGHHNNYVYNRYNTSNMDVIGVELTISPVMMQNFSQTYIFLVDGLDLLAVISPPDVSEKLTVVEIALICGGSLTAVIGMVAIVIYCWLNFHEISFWCKTRCNWTSRTGQFLYDTAVICIEQDNTEVYDRLLPTLKEKGYRVYFAPEDLQEGRGETTGQTDMFPNTYSAIMFISEQSLEENNFQFICKCATSLIGGPYLIVVKKRHIPKTAWKNVPHDLKSRFKVILTLTLPDYEGGRSSKDLQRFWNSIESKLPKPCSKDAESMTINTANDTDDESAKLMHHQ